MKEEFSRVLTLVVYIHDHLLTEDGLQFWSQWDGMMAKNNLRGSTMDTETAKFTFQKFLILNLCLYILSSANFFHNATENKNLTSKLLLISYQKVWSILPSLCHSLKVTKSVLVYCCIISAASALKVHQVKSWEKKLPKLQS